MNCELEDKIFDVKADNFKAVALDMFRFQFGNNPVYRSFASAVGATPDLVQDLTSIPFLPVSFFKTHEVKTGQFHPELVFESSGTTSTGNSRHFLKSAAIYRDSFMKGFRRFYGDPSDWCIVGLLPSYLERKHSSLVMMVDELIRASRHPDSAFYLYEHEKLATLIRRNEDAGQKTLLIGVTFALLDFAADFPMTLKHTTVMETGGMKGRRRELTRPEVHDLLNDSWKIQSIRSEYGMTELLSQAYSPGNGLFRCPPWMRIVLREEDDPLTCKAASPNEQSGLVNVIDLANIYSCSFIATDDLGRLYPDGSFEIEGRMDSSDVRGCSLMYA